MINNVKAAFDSMKSEGTTTTGLIKFSLIGLITVLVIFFFKIPVWKPVKKTYRRAKRRYVKRRRRRMTRRARRYKVRR